MLGPPQSLSPGRKSVLLVGGVCNECDDSGFGEAVLEQCLARGWRVGVVDAHPRLKAGGRARDAAWVCPAAEAADWEAVVQELARRLSASALVNLASHYRWSRQPALFQQSSVEDLRAATRAEVLIPMAAIRGVLRQFLGAGTGVVLNVCSYRHSLASPAFAMHSANMAALASATASLAAEYGRRGVWVGGIGVGPLARADSEDNYAWVAALQKRSSAQLDARGLATTIVNQVATPDWSCVGGVLTADGGVSPFGVGSGASASETSSLIREVRT